MQPDFHSAIPGATLAVFAVNGGKPHQGLAGRNPALYPVREVCKSTVLLGLRGQAKLNRIGSCSTGKERDIESGNDYFGARYYDSNIGGRFLTADWSKNPQSVPYADYTNPQSLNLYAYVGNNPLSDTDPDGHCCDPSTAMPIIVVIPPSWLSNQYVQGGAQVLIGGGLVATAAVGDEPGAVEGGAIVMNALKTFNTALAGASAVVNGTTGIMGAAANTDVSEAQKGLAATSNVPGLVTTAATWNLKAGNTAAVLGNAGALATSPQEALKNPATAADATETVANTGGLIRGAIGAVKNFLDPAPPPSPPPPQPPSNQPIQTNCGGPNQAPC